MARRIRGDRGAELIEMAIVTPILLLIVAGIFDFGMLFRSWEVVTNAAREGARVGVLPSFTADENVRLRVEQYMNAGGVATSCTLATPPLGSPCPTGAGLCTVCVRTETVTLSTGSISARVVTVMSTQSLPSLSVIGTFFGGSFGTVDVAGTSTMRTEAAAGP